MTGSSTNPYCSPALNTTADRSVRSAEIRQRYRLVVAAYLVFALVNAMAGLWPAREPAIRLLGHVTLASIMTYWCVVDSRLRGKPIVRSLHAIIFIAWLIAVPMYLIGTRKLRGLWLVLAHAVGLLVAGLVGYHAAGFLAYRGAWLDVLAR